MRSYTVSEVQRALGDAGVRDGDALFVHASLFALGRPTDASSDLPRRLVAAMQECVGPRGTLSAPAFTYSFCRGAAFDRWTSPAEDLGVLAEALRTTRGAERTRHPMQSIAVLGALKEELCAIDTFASFDDDGPFARLLARDAKLLLLGASIQATSLVHLAECRCAVPYRYWKAFRGRYIDRTSDAFRTYGMHVRDLTLNPQLNLRPLEAALGAKARKARVGSGRILVVTFRDFMQEVTSRLERDAWSLVEPQSVSSTRDL